MLETVVSNFQASRQWCWFITTYIFTISCYPLPDRVQRLQLNTKKQELVQIWWLRILPCYKICWTSQIASQWTIQNHKTISSERCTLHQCPTPNTAKKSYCISLLSNLDICEASSDSMDPLCLFPSTENPTTLPQFVAFTHWEIMILQILTKKWWSTP